VVCNSLNKDSGVIKEALKVLDKKNLALIIHSNSFPSLINEDTGFGNANSNGGKKVIDFASGLFNVIQLGPAGKTKSCDSSPYTSTIFSNNPLFIDLKQLTTTEWGNILSEKTFKEIVSNNPNKNKGKTAYSYIYYVQQKALKEAWENFKKWDNDGIKKELETYKRENSFWLEKDALYEALSIENNNDYWPLWQSDSDKNLFNPKSIEEQLACGERIKKSKQNILMKLIFTVFANL